MRESRINFCRKAKKENNADGRKYAVYLKVRGNERYVCDMIDGNSVEDNSINELGLTLRVRLTRSQGKYAMLEGTIFNPERLLKAVCSTPTYQQEEFSGDEYKKGYTLLSITADGCENKYMVFDKMMLESLVSELRLMQGRASL